MIGLYLVQRYLPTHRADEVDPLDVTDGPVRGRCRLLSYVLEVFGEHTLSVLEMTGLLSFGGGPAAGVLAPCVAGLPSRAAH